jgi:hypothetical protein
MAEGSREEARTESFVYLKDLTRTVLVLSSQPQIINGERLIALLESIIGSPELMTSNMDYTSIFLKGFLSKVKIMSNYLEEYPQFALKAARILIEKGLSFLKEKNEEHFCKILEYTLKIIFKLYKNQPDSLIKDSSLSDSLKDKLEWFNTRYSVNANILAIYIKIKAALISPMSTASDLEDISLILRTNAYSD